MTDEANQEVPDPSSGQGPEHLSFYPPPPPRPPARSGPPGCGITTGAFGVGALFMLAAGGVGEFYGLEESQLLLLLQLALAAGAASFLMLTGYPLKEAFRVRPVSVAIVPVTVQLAAALLIANLGAALVLGPSARDIDLVTGDMGAGDRVLLSLTVALVAPLVEESLFRGLVQGGLEARTKYWVAIVLAAVPFALLHGWPGMIFFFAWSLPLGWVTWRTASIAPAVLVHAVNNVVGVIVLFAAGPVEPQTMERGTQHYLAAAVMLTLAAAWTVKLCARLGREYDGGDR